MAYDLDAPTVFRVGAPTLGPPALSLEYRGVVAPEPLQPPIPIPPMTPTPVALLDARLTLLEARVAALERPWPHRLLDWLRAHWPF